MSDTNRLHKTIANWQERYDRMDEEIARTSKFFTVIFTFHDTFTFVVDDRTYEIREWCEDNCSAPYLAFPTLPPGGFAERDYSIYFSSVADAALFKLVFL